MLNKEEKQILKQIRKNNPKLDISYSMDISKIIYRNSKKYNLSPRVLTAMLMQESAYKVSAQNIKCGLSINTGKKDCIVVDFGIGQINHKTIRAFKFDRKKLLTDVAYSIEAASKVLHDFKRMYGQKDREYWTRYNASTIPKREIYKRLVTRYF